jgi:DedD protein
VADLTHDIADDGFHEIHLSGKQLVFLFMATTVVAVLIFLCGVQVGRGVPIQQQAVDQFGDPASSAANTPSPVPADAGPPAAEPPAPITDGEELGYKRRLEEPAPREPLAASRPPAPEPAPEPSAKAEPEPPPATAKPSPAPGAAQRKPPTSASGEWVIQISALKDRRVANNTVQRLVKRGYPAFLVSAPAPGGMYKVQVGRFKDRGDADRMKQRLEKEEQLKPWVTR